MTFGKVTFNYVTTNFLAKEKRLHIAAERLQVMVTKGVEQMSQQSKCAEASPMCIIRRLYFMWHKYFFFKEKHNASLILRAYLCHLGGNHLGLERTENRLVTRGYRSL